jgi:uncharacterized membrane protein YfcA
VTPELPVSSFEAALLFLPLVSFVISFFTSMAGVSGAFLLLPFQVSVLGFASPAVSATNHLYNVLATPSGVARYAREGRMLWPLTWVLVAGTVPGAVVGALVRVRFLPDPASFKLFAGLVLLYVGGRMLRERVGLGPKLSPAGSEAAPHSHGRSSARTITVSRVRPRRISYVFAGEEHAFSTPGVFGLSLAVGVLGGAYGIGGGAIVAPLLVSWFRLPVHSVAGAALGATGLTSVAAVGSYQALALLDRGAEVAPDWTLGLLFGLGGMAGMCLGARWQRRVPARAIEWMLGLILISVAIRYVAGYLVS